MGINSYLTYMKNRILLLCTAGMLFSGLSYAQTGNGGTGNTKDSTKTKSSVPKPCPGKTCGKKKS
jgi:hypothetical protein